MLKRQVRLTGYGTIMEVVYGKIAGAEVNAQHSLNGEALPDRFLPPERLTLQRID